MAKDLTPYQRRIVDRYYQHKDIIHATKLSEIVSEIAVESDPKRLDRLWKSAGDYLAKCGVEAPTIAAAIPARNLPLLGQVAGAIMSGKRPPVAERTQRRA